MVLVPCAPATAAWASSVSVISRRMLRSSSDGDALEDRFEEWQSVGRAEQGIHRPFGVWHHAEHVARPIEDTRNVAHRAVGVVRLLGLERARRVAEDDAPFALEPIQRLVVRAVAPVAVR